MSQNPLDLGCLRPFDMVARHRNLSRAATALGMTQPALSYRIKQMEDLLGVRLFRRRHRGLELTAEGETLQGAVRVGLERIDEVVQSICRRARTPTVRLATDFAFAAFRLMPRVADFRVRIPPRGGSAALVETRIRWGEGAQAVTTVGVDPDQIGAAVLATDKLLARLSAAAGPSSLVVEATTEADVDAPHVA